MPAVAPAEQVGLRHVARAVAEEGDGQAGEVAAVLADGEQVGEQLAGVEVVGQGVDDGDGRARGHLLEAGLARRCARRWPRPGARARARCRTAVSLPPSWLLAVQMMSGLPPRSAMPTAKETRVRVEDLSKMTATVCGPASGFGTEAVALQLDGQVEDLGLLGRGEVVVAEEVAGHAAVSLRRGRRASTARERAGPKRCGEELVRPRRRR